MKTFKRFSAILLAVLLMVAMMAVPASAAGEYSITINNSNPDHTYEAYQIFTGDLSAGGVLSNVVWGEGLTDGGKSALGSNASAVASGLTTDNAPAFAESLLPYLANPSGSADTLENVTVLDQTVTGYKISGLKAGYYLIRDKVGTLSGKDEAHTTLILKVVDNITIAPKASKATVTKKVSDPANFTNEVDTGWADSTDGKTGDEAQFILTATMPNDYTTFKHYHLTFHDKMASGFKTPSSVVVKVDGTVINASEYTLDTNPSSCSENCSFHVQFADLKNIQGATVGNNSKITVEYSAELLPNMTVGQAGNDNSVKLEYSNDPYFDPAGNVNETSGMTLADAVTVFTYKLEIYKRDHSSNPLPGAKFKVEKYDKADDVWGWVDLTPQIQESNGGTTFTITGIDEGLFRVTETTTPSGFNTITPFYFRVDADYNVLSDDPSLNTLYIDQCAADGSALSANDRNPLVATQSDVSNGLVQIRVANRGGSQLPETGGIGTSIFYGIGGVLVIGALALLTVRKRSTAK